MSKLKVYRTSTGFHDAYVAAPSQKAALKAWGSEHDLFARGAAEVVTDPALMKEPLDRPGEVIRRLRGTTAEQIAALPPDEPRRRASGATRGESEPAPPKKAARKPVPVRKRQVRPSPPPDRAALDDIERTLADAGLRHRREAKAIADQEAALARRRRKLEKEQAAEMERLERLHDRATAAYERAVKRWRG